MKLRSDKCSLTGITGRDCGEMSAEVADPTTLNHATAHSHLNRLGKADFWPKTPIETSPMRKLRVNLRFPYQAHFL